jgi:hypothetical protein
MQSIDPASSGILDTQSMVMQNASLVEAVRVIGGWKKASTVEEVKANNTNTRISSKNIFGHAGSATGDQALAMLKASEE